MLLWLRLLKCVMFYDDIIKMAQTSVLILFSRNNSKGHLASTQPAALDALTCMEFNVLRPTLIACGHASGGVNYFWLLFVVLRKKKLFSFCNSFTLLTLKTRPSRKCTSQGRNLKKHVSHEDVSYIKTNLLKRVSR